MDVIEAWTADLRDVLGGDDPAVADVRVGVFYTAARLSTGEAGVAFTPRDLAETVCCPRTAAEAPRAGRLAGSPAWELAGEALAPVALRRAVGVAVLNALSARAVDRVGLPAGRLLAGTDALDAAGVQEADTVAMVGAFVPFIKALKGRVRDLRIVDKHPQALKPDERPLWRAPAEARETLAAATVVIVTASVLVEGGLDDLLRAARDARVVVLAGPTAPAWPPPFFARGVDVLGGIRVRDGAALLRVVGEGGSGYFFEDAAEKIAIVR
jgi:uncharacterized protein (DUF4213/DUF364 family)